MRMTKLSGKDTKIDRKMTVLLRGQIVDLKSPKIMGILNVTPDSFSDGGQFNTPELALQRVEQMVKEGVDWVDIGAQSTRPQSDYLDAKTEWTRLEPVLKSIRQSFPDLIASIDTFHSEVARRALDHGADIINDVSGGKLDKEMFRVVAEARAPYILMHMRGTPQTMKDYTEYEHLVRDVTLDLATRTRELIDAGVNDIIIDPGFGFAKTIEQNFELLKHLEHLHFIGHPILVGVSRKSMIWKSLDIDPAEADNGTTALNMHALQSGVAILRVHNVRAAVETRTLWNRINGQD